MGRGVVFSGPLTGGQGFGRPRGRWSPHLFGGAGKSLCLGVHFRSSGTFRAVPSSQCDIHVTPESPSPSLLLFAWRPLLFPSGSTRSDTARLAWSGARPCARLPRCARSSCPRGLWQPLGFGTSTCWGALDGAASTLWLRGPSGLQAPGLVLRGHVLSSVSGVHCPSRFGTSSGAHSPVLGPVPCLQLPGPAASLPPETGSRTAAPARGSLG